MEKKDYIVAVDLGDSNVVVAVGTAASGGCINVEHIFSKPSKGVRAGKIENINQAIESIESVLDELREQTGIKPLELYAGISGEFIYCTSHTDHVYVPDHKFGVTQQVVDALSERMNNVMVSEERFIMERIPQRYVINGSIEVDNPVGVFGSPLSSTYNFISADNEFYCRLDMAIRRLSITPRRIFSNAVVVGDAVLTSDEKEEGVVVVDMGGDLTDIAIYRHNILRYISTIPIGAKTINSDIRTLTIPERYIESLKLKYGCALSSLAPQDFSVIIKGRSKHDHREIAIYNLAAVIEARLRDIAELIAQEIADSGFDDSLPYGIVLTGGSAQLRGIDELLKEVTGYDVRVAEAEDIVSPETIETITSSADSTVVGLLIHGMKYGACEVEIVESRKDRERQAAEIRRAEEEKRRREREEIERKAEEERQKIAKAEAEKKAEEERIAKEAEDKRKAQEAALAAAKAAEEAKAAAEAAAKIAAEAAAKAAESEVVKVVEPIEEVKPAEPIEPIEEVKPVEPAKPKPEPIAPEPEPIKPEPIKPEPIAAEAPKQEIKAESPKQPKRTLPPPPSIEEEDEQEEQVDAAEQVKPQKGPAKPADRMKKFLEMLSKRANKVVDDVNGHFDVKDDDEEV